MCGGRKTREPGEKNLSARQEPTTNLFNPQMSPGQNWWEGEGPHQFISLKMAGWYILTLKTCWRLSCYNSSNLTSDNNHLGY